MTDEKLDQGNSLRNQIAALQVQIDSLAAAAVFPPAQVYPLDSDGKQLLYPVQFSADEMAGLAADKLQALQDNKKDLQDEYDRL